jgi:hypothetical protein
MIRKRGSINCQKEGIPNWNDDRITTNASPAPVSAETQANRDAADVFLNEFYRVDSPEPVIVGRLLDIGDSLGTVIAEWEPVRQELRIAAEIEVSNKRRIAALEALLREAEADIYWANVVLKERIRAALEG